VQLSVLAHVTVPIIERYYLVIAVLLKSGSGRISQDVLESQCQLMAQRMSLLYELNSPEFFDKALFKNFHRSAARPQRTRRQRRRAAHLHGHAARRRRRRAAGAARADPQQRAASHASLRPLMTIIRLLAVATLLAGCPCRARRVHSFGAGRCGARLERRSRQISRFSTTAMRRCAWSCRRRYTLGWKPRRPLQRSTSRPTAAALWRLRRASS
jgi:hypothetical protein